MFWCNLVWVGSVVDFKASWTQISKISTKWSFSLLFKLLAHCYLCLVLLWIPTFVYWCIWWCFINSMDLLYSAVPLCSDWKFPITCLWAKILFCLTESLFSLYTAFLMLFFVLMFRIWFCFFLISTSLLKFPFLFYIYHFPELSICVHL